MEAAFPTTSWTSVFAEPDGETRRRRLDGFCRAYWRPVFQFLRAASRRPDEDVLDLTQAFFEHFLEADLVRRYEPSRGPFRHFLKGALRRFLGEQRRDARRLKRGGAVAIVPLDPDSALLADPRQKTPDELFDEQWADDVLRHGIEELERSVSRDVFEVYRRYELADGDESPTYDDVAKATGMAPHDVENRLSTARRMLRSILLRLVSDYATSDEELRDEMRELRLE